MMQTDHIGFCWVKLVLLEQARNGSKQDLNATGFSPRFDPRLIQSWFTFVM